MPASKGGTRRLKVTIEFSFFPPVYVATYAQTRSGFGERGCRASAFSAPVRAVERGDESKCAHVVTIALAAQVTRKAGKKVAGWLTRLARKLRDGFKKHDSHQTVSCFLAPSGSSYSYPSCPGKVKLFSLGFWWDLQSEGRDALTEGEYRTV